MSDQKLTIYCMAIVQSTANYFQDDDNAVGGDRKVTAIDVYCAETKADARIIEDGWCDPLPLLRTLGVTRIAPRFLMSCNEYTKEDLPVIFAARRLGITLEEAATRVG